MYEKCIRIHIMLDVHIQIISFVNFYDLIFDDD